MTASTPDNSDLHIEMRRALTTLKDLPAERQDELAEALLRYTEQFRLPVIR